MIKLVSYQINIMNKIITLRDNLMVMIYMKKLKMLVKILIYYQLQKNNFNNNRGVKTPLNTKQYALQNNNTRQSNY